MKIIFVELDRCLACRNCEQVCSFQEAGGFKRENSNIWVQIDLEKRSIFTMTCLQCETALCLEVCPTEGLIRDPKTNAVVVDEAACVGCKMCVVACPFGNIHFESKRQVAAKCNLCNGDPRCVQNCMPGALHYGDVNDLAAIKRKHMDKKLIPNPSSAKEKAPYGR
ncbi:MAG: 4Fe-4S dicluster domain-containing protein [Deltaproteobacteria bacterium]|nr:4Fe-4S dicluster domain-containing protein [Deltaproteobacteria bacterium]